MEYNTCVWCPYLLHDIHSCERVQKQFTKRMFNRCHISFKDYQDRLTKLSIKSLEYRRVEFDLILTFKIVHGLIDLNFHDFFTYTSSTNVYNLRRHILTLKNPDIARSAVRNNFFSSRIVSTWNALPNDIVNSQSLLTFKLKFKQYNLRNVCRFTC